MSFSYTLTYKTVPDLMQYTSQLTTLSPSIVSVLVDADNSSIKINSSQELYSGALATLDAVTPEDTPIQQTVEKSIKGAIEFGSNLVIEFAAENVLLGITQAGKTSDVRKATKEVVDALYTGSLYDAIDECRAIPSEDKDATYVTDARLLGFINKIEEYPGMTLSTSL